jgi:two-component system, OmpR family, aerobic respiration control protein ArcA
MSKLDPKSIFTKKLAKQIEGIKKKKMLGKKVVSLSDFRSIKKDISPKHILVVDDDETTRNVLKRLFEKEGYDVLLAPEATELVKILEVNPVELIMLDINLPWVNGFELCKILKEQDDLKDVPVVFISGRKSEIDKKHAFKLGAHDYITKPFTIDEVTQTVKTLLSLHSAK